MGVFNKHLARFLGAFLISLAFSVSAQVDPQATVGVQMADSIMIRKPNVYRAWDYEAGTVLRGFEELYKTTGDSRYLEYIKSTVDSVIDANGVISGYNMGDYNLDEVKEGSSVLYLHQIYDQARYVTAVETLMEQLDQQPQTPNGGNWHKYKYPNQMWLDGLYMAQPFNVQFGTLFGRPENYADAVNQLQIIENQLRDPITGLLFHAWDASGNAWWADPITNASPIFWGRSLGWYSMALVDVLDFIPQQNSAQREQIIGILERLLTALAAVQDPTTGVWWQVADRGGDSGNWIESSATAMFVYATAKAVRLGYVDSSFAAMANDGWQGLLNEFITVNPDNTINLIQTCEGTGVDSTYSFYIGRAALTNDPKGLGPFLMASAEMEYGGQAVNLPPVIKSPLEDIAVAQGSAPIVIELDDVFVDPDQEALSFLMVSGGSVAQLSGNQLILESSFIGQHQIQISATDPSGAEVMGTFIYEVISGDFISIELEAEDQNWSSATVDSNHQGFTGAGFVNTQNVIDVWVEFTVLLATAGNYEVSVRYANGATNRPQQILVNGSEAISSVDFINSGSWATWQNVNFNLDLSAGSNTVRLISLTSAGAANIDHFIISGEGEDENLAPVINQPIADVSLELGTIGSTINLNSIFSDPEQQPLSFSISPASSNLSLSGNELAVFGAEVGTETISVIATDIGGLSTTQQFELVVYEVNQAPVVVQPMMDQLLTVGDSTIQLNLSDVFGDPDGDDLTYELFSEDQNVALDNAVLTLAANSVGVAIYSIVATDPQGLTVTDEFQLQVLAANQSPTVITPIANITLTEGDSGVTHDLNSVFSDADGDTLSFSVVSAGGQNNLELTGSSLSVMAADVGSSSHTVTASDGDGASVNTSFNLTVLELQLEDEIILQAEDQTWSSATVDSNHAGYNGAGFVNTSNVLGAWVEFEIQVATAAEYTLFLRYANGSTNRNQQVLVNGQQAISDLPLITSGGWAVWSEAEFSLNLQAGSNLVRFVSTTSSGAPNLDQLTINGAEEANLPPVVITPIDDVTMVQGNTAIAVDLTGVFADPDGGALSYTGSASAPTNNIYLNGNTLYITAEDVEVVTFTVTATDIAGATVSETFVLSVSAPNQAPTVLNPIDNLIMTLGDEVLEFDLLNIFNDAHGDILSFSITSSASSSNVNLMGNSLFVSASDVGNFDYSITASDGNGGEASFQFSLQVNAVQEVFELELQAEDQSWSVATVDSNHLGFTGAGFVNTQNAVGEWVAFSAVVPVSGVYSITVRYANGSTDRAQQVDVNGSLALSSVSFNNSGGWAVWTEQTFNLNLSAGFNEIVFTSLSSGGAPNLDKIDVVLQ